MHFNNRTYDRLKFIALVLLPGISAAYFTLAQIWGLPNAEEVVGTISVVDTFLGMALKASNTEYRKVDPDTDGDLLVNDEGGDRHLFLSVKKDSLAGMDTKDTVTLRVIPPRPTETGNGIWMKTERSG